MKRSAWVFCLLGLVGFAAPSFSQESTTKTQKKDPYESSQSKDKSQMERTTTTDPGSGTAKSDPSVTPETKRSTDGTTDTQAKSTEKQQKTTK
jgi:hypothetical protein